MILKKYTVGVKCCEDWQCIHDLLTYNCNEDCIPSRPCNCIDDCKHSKYRSVYELTDDEALMLEKHPKINYVKLSPSYNPSHYGKPELFDIPMTNLKYNLSSAPTNNYQDFKNSTEYIQSKIPYNSAESYDPGPALSALNQASSQIYRSMFKHNPWVVNNLSNNETIVTTPSSNPLLNRGGGENVDVLVFDNGVWFGHPEYNSNTINAENPKDYKTGNLLSVSGTCQLLDLYFDAPMVIDREFFIGNPDKTTYRWDGTYTALETAAIDWWSSNSLSARSGKFVSNTFGGSATGDNDFGFVPLKEYVDENVTSRGVTFDRNTYNGSPSSNPFDGISLFGAHGTRVASLAYGRTHGMAYNSNKWTAMWLLDYNNSSLVVEPTIDMMKIYHNTKPDNTETNDKNPMIVNNSWGYLSNDPLNTASFLNWRDKVYDFSGKQSTKYTSNIMRALIFPFKDSPLTQAADELVESNVIWTAAAGNSNMQTVNSDHPNFNNMFMKTLSTEIGDSEYTLEGYDAIAYSNRRGFPAHAGQFFENGKLVYPCIQVGALDSQFSEDNKERAVSYSMKGNSIDVYATADDTLAALNFFDGRSGIANSTIRYDNKVGTLNTALSSSDGLMNGTSAANPVSVGILATILQHHRNWTWRELKNWIKNKVGIQEDQYFYNNNEPVDFNDVLWDDKNSLQGGLPYVLYQADITDDGTSKFSITSSVLSAEQGSSFNITLSSVNVPNNTLVPYSISGVEAEDIDNSPLNGNFVVGLVDNIPFSVTRTNEIEPQKTMVMSLDNGESNTDTILGQATYDPTLRTNPQYPGIVQTDETCFRFSDKSIQGSERILFSNWWREQINQYGTKVKYYVNTYNLLSADNFYGEETTKIFAEPKDMVLAVTLNENAIELSKFGFESDDAITAYIHISSFYDNFNTLPAYENQFNIIEPKAGDIFQLSEYGNDRPSERQPKYFEVTEKLDQDINLMNQLGGHYVFLLKAKRLDYSFEPNIPFSTIGLGISGNQQVYEDSIAGRLSGGTNEPTERKKDQYDEYIIDDISKNEVFDMSQNDTDVYGDYY